MKLSAILLSVTLPVAASTAAYSAEPAKGGNTSEWLKQNLSSLDGKQQKKTSTRPRKGAFSQPVADESVGLRAAPALKMRPFVANRRLPSQRELDMQLIAQTAKMASSQPPAFTSQTAMMATAPQPLAGNVSEVYSMMPYGSSSAGNVATYGAVGYVPQSSSRVVPGQMPAVQSQIRQFHSGKRTRYIAPAHAPTMADLDSMSPPLSMPSSPPPLQTMMQSALPSPGQLLGQQQSMPMQMQMSPQQPQAQRFNAPMLVPMQAPPFTPDEQAILDRMSMMQSGNSGSDSVSSAGPAPFPLSLLPQDSLKQVISQSRSRRSDAPPSYFGCWHGAPQTASLPQSGFHTYTGGSSTYGNHYSHYSAHSAGGGPLAAHQASRSRPKSAGETTHALGQLRRLPPQDVKVASYSAYPRISGSGY
jgi:hypothetical protein